MGKKFHAAKLPDGTEFFCINRMEMFFCYKEIFDSGAYKNPMIAVKSGDVVLDVGANIGLFLHYISQLCPDCVFYAFEPIPRICRALDENARRLKCREARIFSCGLSDSPGEATFTFLRNVTARSTMYPEFSPADNSPQSQAREMGFMLQTFKEVPNTPLRWGIAALPPFARRGLARAAVKFHARKRQVTCPLMTLSQVIDQQGIAQVDLLKIDVEGAERAVLKGIRDEHWPLIRQLIVETHPGPGDVLADVRAALETRGFQTAISDQTLHPAPTVFAARESK